MALPTGAASKVRAGFFGGVFGAAMVWTAINAASAPARAAIPNATDLGTNIGFLLKNLRRQATRRLRLVYQRTKDVLSKKSAGPKWTGQGVDGTLLVPPRRGTLLLKLTGMSPASPLSTRT